MNTELNVWADKVKNSAKPILEKYKLDFYPFQAKLNLKSNVLIIGLNPASQDGYDGTKVFKHRTSRNRVDK